MAPLLSIAALSFIISVIIPSGSCRPDTDTDTDTDTATATAINAATDCAGYSISSWDFGNNPVCSNPTERTGWTWFWKLDCNCCPGFAQVGTVDGTRGSCVPICWSECAKQDPNTKCTDKQIEQQQNFVDPYSKHQECPGPYEKSPNDSWYV